VFIIAHRLSTVRGADRIITIERGRIVEDGSHDELIRSNGRYAKLHHLQAGIHDVR
jgi:subfamily B ATP-binding cassette protein HlyB/CyaB